jgi:hypothetical protein
MSASAMAAVWSINLAIGNLLSLTVDAIELHEKAMVLQFRKLGDCRTDFAIHLQGVLGFVDHGVVLQPLTAGIVWNPAAQFGHELASRAGRDPTRLMELRLDFEDSSGLVIRFNAVAETIRLHGPHT